MTDIHDNPEALVDLALERVGRELRVGAPLGLGKPVQLLNAFYRRAAADPTISLQIFTALSLEVPTPSTQIEEALAGRSLSACSATTRSWITWHPCAGVRCRRTSVSASCISRPAR
jgi:hypothetical protein